jgi:hypothetical protein
MIGKIRKSVLVLTFIVVSIILVRDVFAGAGAGEVVKGEEVGTNYGECIGFLPGDLIECYSAACSVNSFPYFCGSGIYRGNPACPSQCALDLAPMVIGDVCEVGGREVGSGKWSTVSNGIRVRHGSCTSLISYDTVGAILGYCGVAGYYTQAFIYSDTASAVWDGSEKKLITCNGRIEDKIYGTTSEVRCECGALCLSCSCSPYAGDGQCESACNAASACDEKSPNTDLTKCSCGKTYFADRCDSNCGCVDRIDNICRSSAFASDCTADSRCNGYQPGQQGGCPSGYTCNNNCQCEQTTTPTTPPSCTNECPSFGVIVYRCNGNLLQSARCGNYDSDTCWEIYDSRYGGPGWTTVSNCASASDSDGGRIYTTQGTCTQGYCSVSGSCVSGVCTSGSCSSRSYTDYCVSTGTCSGTSYCAQITDEWVCYEMGCWYWDGICHPTCDELTNQWDCQSYGCTWTPGSTTQLAEYYVSGSSCVAETVTCSGGCSNGACAGCTGCLIGGTCYQNGAVNPSNPCQYCDVSRSTTSWSNYPDGTACTRGDCGAYTAYCLSGTCTCRDSCKSNSECIPEYCCTDDSTDPNAPKTGEYKCVRGVYPPNSRYLCDPPEWDSESISSEKVKTSTFFDSILNFFTSLFAQA